MKQSSGASRGYSEIMAELRALDRGTLSDEDVVAQALEWAYGTARTPHSVEKILLTGDISDFVRAVAVGWDRAGFLQGAFNHARAVAATYRAQEGEEEPGPTISDQDLEKISAADNPSPSPAMLDEMSKSYQRYLFIHRPMEGLTPEDGQVIEFFEEGAVNWKAGHGPDTITSGPDDHTGIVIGGGWDHRCTHCQNLNEHTLTTHDQSIVDNENHTNR